MQVDWTSFTSDAVPCLGRAIAAQFQRLKDVGEMGDGEERHERLLWLVKLGTVCDLIYFLRMQIINHECVKFASASR